jgi:hypothetical protein
MTRDDTIKLAREAGLKVGTNLSGIDLVGVPLGEYGIAHMDVDELGRFAALVAAAEREACAKLCEAFAEGANYDERDALEGAADAIRGRST